MDRDRLGVQAVDPGRVEEVVFHTANPLVPPPPQMVGREPPQIPHQARPRHWRHAVPYDPSSASHVDVFDPLAVEVHLVAVVTRKPLDLFGDAALGAVTFVEAARDESYAPLRRR